MTTSACQRRTDYPFGSPGEPPHGTVGRGLRMYVVGSLSDTESSDEDFLHIALHQDLSKMGVM